MGIFDYAVIFFRMLTLVFVLLKVAKKIDWSWLWVLSPLVGELAIDALVLGIAMLFLL